MKGGWRHIATGLGAAAVVVASLSADASGSTSSRIAGADQYATAAMVSAATFPTGVPVAYVATGHAYADALASAPAAVKNRGPVLLTEPDVLSQPTADELVRLAPGRIVILGGTAAVTAAVEARLRSYSTGGVSRVAGADRFATAAALSATTFAGPAKVVYVVNGDEFPDALAAGPAAASADGPVLLVHEGTVPAATSSELARLRPASVVIVGGIRAVSSGVEEQIRTSTGASVTRRGGDDRYATAATVTAHAFSNPGLAKAFLVTGESFADALGAGPAAGAAGGPLLLVRRDCVPEATANELTRLNPAEIVVVGGTNAVSLAAESGTRCDTPPTTTTTNPAEPWCRASAPSNPSPRVPVTSTSNLPGRSATATAHYPTGNVTDTAITDAYGTARFVIYQPQGVGGGQRVEVDVDVAGGTATCRASFTTWPN